jgi:hypothetical protein
MNAEDGVTYTHSSDWSVTHYRAPLEGRVCDTDKGWKMFQGQCYLLLDSLASWHAQKAACESVGGLHSSLASIHHEKEHDFVVSLMPYEHSDPNSVSRYQYLWIGVQPDAVGPGGDPVIVNPTHWLDGSAISYTKWKTNQPTQNEGCSEIYRSASNNLLGEWHDNDCNALSRAVCKKPASVSTASVSTV